MAKSDLIHVQVKVNVTEGKADELAKLLEEGGKTVDAQGNVDLWQWSISSNNKLIINEIFRSNENIKLTLMASGSEVDIAVSAAKKLAEKNIYTKVISVPSMELFDAQPENYKLKVLGETELKISIEASQPMSWKKYVGKNGATLGIEGFGKSAPYKDVYEYFKLTDDDVVNAALRLENINA